MRNRWLHCIALAVVAWSFGRLNSMKQSMEFNSRLATAYLLCMDECELTVLEDHLLEITLCFEMLSLLLAVLYYWLSASKTAI